MSGRVIQKSQLHVTGSATREAGAGRAQGLKQSGRELCMSHTAACVFMLL